ncbi:MAG: HAMP domain-containing sensor histidine kinase [Bacteroidota bacterium]
MNTTSNLHQRSSTEELYRQSQYFTRQLPFQYFSDSLTEFVTILNKNRQIVFCNRPLISYLKADDVNGLIGKRPGEALQCQHADNTCGGCGTTEFCTMCGANIAIRHSQNGIEDIQECRIISEPDTKALEFQVHATPFTYNNDFFTIFSLTDTSDEKRRKVLESLFFHDVMNMVGGLLGYSELLQDATTEEAKEYGAVIHKLVNDLSDQIIGQRELTYAEHHETKVRASLIHAKTFLTSILIAFEKHRISKNKTIEIDPAVEDFLFVSDEHILRRVLGNLTKNALEATDFHSSIRLSCSISDTSVIFSVHNHQSMLHDVQMQVFQRSFSTKGQGRGLGTYSVKLFTEQYLKGTVTFLSNEEIGTTFTVALPIALKGIGADELNLSEGTEKILLSDVTQNK